MEGRLESLICLFWVTVPVTISGIFFFSFWDGLQSIPQLPACEQIINLRAPLENLLVNIILDLLNSGEISFEYCVKPFRSRTSSSAKGNYGRWPE